MLRPALEVQLLLDLVTAGVRDVVAEVTELGQVAPQGAFRDSGAVGKLARVQPGLRDDRGQDSQQSSQPLSAIHRRARVRTAVLPRGTPSSHQPRLVAFGRALLGDGRSESGLQLHRVARKSLPRKWWRSHPRTGRARPPPGSRLSGGTDWRSSGRPSLWGCRAW